MKPLTKKQRAKLAADVRLRLRKGLRGEYPFISFISNSEAYDCLGAGAARRNTGVLLKTWRASFERWLRTVQ